MGAWARRVRGSGITLDWTAAAILGTDLESLIIFQLDWTGHQYLQGVLGIVVIILVLLICLPDLE